MPRPKPSTLLRGIRKTRKAAWGLERNLGNVGPWVALLDGSGGIDKVIARYIRRFLGRMFGRLTGRHGRHTGLLARILRL